jgi:hypothetical protein
VGAGTALITVSGGEIEARYINFLHSGNSKGAYFNASQSGVVVLNESQILADPLSGCVLFLFNEWYKKFLLFYDVILLFVELQPPIHFLLHRVEVQFIL